MNEDVDEQRFCSTDAAWSSSANWRALHLRRYRHEQVVEEVQTRQALDQVLVLVTRGSTLIESFRAGGGIRQRTSPATSA